MGVTLFELGGGGVGVPLDGQVEHPQDGRQRCRALQPPLLAAPRTTEMSTRPFLHECSGWRPSRKAHTQRNDEVQRRDSIKFSICAHALARPSEGIRIEVLPGRVRCWASRAVTPAGRPAGRCAGRHAAAPLTPSSTPAAGAPAAAPAVASARAERRHVRLFAAEL